MRDKTECIYLCVGRSRGGGGGGGGGGGEEEQEQEERLGSRVMCDTKEEDTEREGCKGKHKHKGRREKYVACRALFPVVSKSQCACSQAEAEEENQYKRRRAVHIRQSMTGGKRRREKNEKDDE